MTGAARPGDRIFGAFDRWRLWDDREIGGPLARVAGDDTLGEAVASGASPPAIRLWENEQALVISRRERRLPRYAAAARATADAGWPVVPRQSGGDAVPHGPGILLFSLVLPRNEELRFPIEAVYRALVDPLQAALEALGIETEFGEAPGSFCDGRFNLLHRGRKLAGTAQRWRGGLAGVGAGRGYVLAHALVLVEPDLVAATTALNRFYEVAGSERRIDPAAATTLRDCLGEAGLPGEGLTQALRGRMIADLKARLVLTN